MDGFETHNKASSRRHRPIQKRKVRLPNVFLNNCSAHICGCHGEHSGGPNLCVSAEFQSDSHSQKGFDRSYQTRFGLSEDLSSEGEDRANRTDKVLTHKQQDCDSINHITCWHQQPRLILFDIRQHISKLPNKMGDPDGHNSASYTATFQRRVCCRCECWRLRNLYNLDRCGCHSQADTLKTGWHFKWPCD